MNEPRSRRDAIVAQLAGELDDLVQRVERLPLRLEEANQRIEGSAAALHTAIEQYRSNVGALTSQVMKNIGEFAVRRTNEAAVKSIEEQQALLQASARQAFELELVPRLRAINDDLARAAVLGPPRRSAWLAYAATAVLSSGLTAAVLLHLLRP